MRDRETLEGLAKEENLKEDHQQSKLAETTEKEPQKLQKLKLADKDRKMALQFK